MTARKTETPLRPVPAFDLGHDRVAHFLESIRRERVPSLLFTGPEGSGKEYTAIEFARRLCCREPSPCELGSGRVCELCARASHLEHPGIHLIYPTPTQGAGEPEDGDVADIAKVLDEKRRDILAQHRFPKKASIRIARARAVIQRANTKPFGSPYNVFVFVDAHAMREEAQNALLKVVEEPPPHCVLIFVTHNPESILYTIRSRCQHVRFHPLKAGAVERLLVDYYGVEDKTARRIAKLSHGNIQRARALVDSFDDDSRQSVLEFITRLPDSSESWVIGRALAAGRGANRDAVARYLHELSVAFRDVMAGTESLLVNRDESAALLRLGSRWDRRRLPRVIDRISRARYEILVRNMNIDAALTSLFLDLHRAATTRPT